jgi:cell division protein FtsZ
LLDEISIDTAAGIIANFSGGNDLTFSEVAETLTYLHEQTGDDTEIIPGVISDPNLSDRAQVILIVTGLGAVPIEVAIPGAEKFLAELPQESEKKKSQEESRKPPLPHQKKSEGQNEKAYSFSSDRPMTTTSDLDVPAFLRKRVRG